MDDSQSVLVRRPQRWDEPLDAAMTDDDAKWLRTRSPFASMREEAFPKATPLHGILKNDCRIRRGTHGEILVREGDYGSSAFLVLSGSVRVCVDRLPETVLGRPAQPKRSWFGALKQAWTKPRFAEVRSPGAIQSEDGSKLGEVDERPAIFLQDFAAIFGQVRSVALGPGELFGEVAAMYRTPQSATVVVEDEATLVEIRWQGLRLLRRDSQFTQQLEQHYRDHWLIPHLRETPLLRFVPDEHLEFVASRTALRSFGRMEWNVDYARAKKHPVEEQIKHEPVIAMEGHLPTDLVLIRSGFARVSHMHGSGHQTTAYLGKGHTFGFGEIAHNLLRPSGHPPRALRHSLRAVGFVDTLHIPVEVAAEHVLPFVRKSELGLTPAESSARGPKQESSGPTADATAQESDASDLERRSAPREKPGEELNEVVDEQIEHVSTGLVEFLVSERLNNGKQALVIDLDRCTRCDDCVKACATTHGGNPRFTRVGPTHDSIMFAQSCMHCVDPVCMIGCPTGAISRDRQAGTISISESICIGCGVCASACPYDNIRMVEVCDELGRDYRDSKTETPIRKATKCDLCQSQPAGPACQNACPHDALVRLDLSQLKPLDQWLGERRS